jgi:hypothetical protein
MDKQATLRNLAHLGVDLVEIEFSGGNDEGYVEATNFDLASGESYSVSGYRDDKDIPAAIIDIVAEVQQPIWDRYGSFAGDFSVYGVYVWDVVNGTSKFKGQETDYVDIETKIAIEQNLSR